MILLVVLLSRWGLAVLDAAQVDAEKRNELPSAPAEGVHLRCRVVVDAVWMPQHPLASKSPVEEQHVTVFTSTLVGTLIRAPWAQPFE
eukprot:312063-Rhodomonas_salina.3